VLLVILSEAKNLSVHWTSSEERFFASLRMAPKIGFFRGLLDRNQATCAVKLETM
jgi:hypothetical protein